MAGLHMVCFHMMNFWITSTITKNNKMHKNSLLNVHQEGCTLSPMTKRTKRQKKANQTKKQKKAKEDFDIEQLSCKIYYNCQGCLWTKHKLSNQPWEKGITELHFWFSEPTWRLYFDQIVEGPAGAGGQRKCDRALDPGGPWRVLGWSLEGLRRPWHRRLHCSPAGTLGAIKCAQKRTGELELKFIQLTHSLTR